MKVLWLLLHLTLAYVVLGTAGYGNAPAANVVQSSTFNDHGVALAIDGDPTTCAKTGYDKGSWWKLDLGNYKVVTGVSILGKVDVFQVRVGNSTENKQQRRGFDGNPLCLFSMGVDAMFAPVRLDCRLPKRGRYVSIQVVDPIRHSQINLCEVTVHTL